MIWHILTWVNGLICRRINHIFLTFCHITSWPRKYCVSIARWSLSPRHLNLLIFWCCELINHSYLFLFLKLYWIPEITHRKFLIGSNYLNQWNCSLIFTDSPGIGVKGFLIQCEKFWWIEFIWIVMLEWEKSWDEMIFNVSLPKSWFSWSESENCTVRLTDSHLLPTGMRLLTTSFYCARNFSISWWWNWLKKLISLFQNSIIF